MSDDKNIENIKALLQLQAIVTQSTQNMQIMQQQLQEHIEQSQNNANQFIERVSNQLPDKVIKPSKETIHQAKTDIQNIAENSQKEFDKMRLYKPFIIHTLLFILVAMFCYLFIYFQKKELEKMIAVNEEQKILLNNYGKHVHMGECLVQGKAYPCSRTYENQPLFKGDDGHYYALVKP